MNEQPSRKERTRQEARAGTDTNRQTPSRGLCAPGMPDPQIALLRRQLGSGAADTRGLSHHWDLPFPPTRSSQAGGAAGQTRARGLQGGVPEVQGEQERGVGAGLQGMEGRRVPT